MYVVACIVVHTVVGCVRWSVDNVHIRVLCSCSKLLICGSINKKTCAISQDTPENMASNVEKYVNEGYR